MRFIVFALLSFLSIQPIVAQISYDGKIGNGIRFNTKDNSFYLVYRTRIQTRWDFEYTPDINLFQNHAYVNRARLKFDGFFINKNLRYKIEYDVVEGYVRDAIIKYRFGNFDFWFGQAKLPSNRERLVSSGDLQFVDRSLFNTYFTLGRDVGFQLHHHFHIGNIVFRDIYAWSSGNGILNNIVSEGFSYSGKIEVLPFGLFKNKGDYKFSDLKREPKPKLSVAAYANFNKSAYKDRGQIGYDLDSKADLLLIGIDLFFKYRGYSFLYEYGKRWVTDGSPLVYNDSGNFIGSYYAGWGSNIQTSYLLKSNWEFALRYAHTTPQSITMNPSIRDYTFAISKYIIDHNFKIQTDFTFRKTLGLPEQFIVRVQLEFQF